MKLRQVYIRPTEKHCGHTNIFAGERKLGYIMPNTSKFSAIGENWNFVPCHDSGLTPLLAKSKAEVFENKKHFKI